MKNKSIILLVFALFALAIFVKSVSAQEQSQTLTLSPFIFEEKMAKGQTVRRDIHLTNNSEQSLNVTTELSDFTHGDSDGQPLFVNEPRDGEEKYALSSWMKLLSPASTVIKPRQTVDFTVEINAPKDAEEGGHYGGGRFLPTRFLGRRMLVPR